MPRSLVPVLLALPVLAGAQLPLKHKPEPTKSEITAADLMTRLYIFADDSMMGRQIGTEGSNKGTAYIEREVRRMGLKPGGDNGTFFQDVPFFSRSVGTATLSAGGKAFAMNTDFSVALPTLGNGVGVAPRTFDGVDVVYGGVLGDASQMITRAQAAGKFVVFKQPPASAGGRGGRGGRGGAQADTSFASSAAAIGVISNTVAQNGRGGPPRGQLVDPANEARAATFQLSPATASALLGGDVDAMTPGAKGARVTGSLQVTSTRLPGRNVVAIYTGTDPKLRGEYVAVGAHSDHVGFVPVPLDHDSVRVFNSFTRVQGLEIRPPQIDTAHALVAAARAALDSIRKGRPARMDSVNNGADDDGSGSVVALEVAEKFATGKAASKRSIIFVWHTGEEAGLLGSVYFTDHPTVTRDSIVAQINMDMVGRGGPLDVAAIADGVRTHGAPNYVELVGTRRISTELGDLVESVNKQQKVPFVLDYQYDALGHPQRIYCRSDHANYARYNIPVAYFTTGLHLDYHQVTDEPEYIDYDHMARIGNLVFDVTQAVANLDHRPLIDHPAVWGAPCR